MMHEKIYQIVVNGDEITWQTILLDSVKKGDLNPWDVDVSLLSQMYIETIKEMQEMNLFVSGKMLLASAILLRIKSDKLLTEGIPVLDSIMYPQEEMHEFEVEKQGRLVLDENPRLTIKNPQTRKRRVTINDLVEALEQALNVNERRIKRLEKRNWIPEISVPDKSVDISRLIDEIYMKVKSFLARSDRVKFSQIIPSESRKDKIMTFVPLLHLASQSKIDLHQNEHFGDFDIKLKEVA